jgi:drug/metabolite transporter (DMT)-like permease
MIPALLATVLFSLSVVFANRTTRMLGGTTANFLRLCLATVVLAAWAHGRGCGLGGGVFGWFFLSGCIGFGLGDSALYYALPRLGPRLTALLMQCLAAPFAALVEWQWLGTTLSLTQIAAGLVILLGVAIAVAPGEHLHLSRRALVLGLGFGVAAALGQGLGAVVSRKAYTIVDLTGEHVDGLTAAYQRILGGMVFATPLTLWAWYRSRQQPRGARATATSEATQDRAGPWRAAWLWVVLNCLAGPTLGVGCYQWALATQPSGIVLPIVATMPIVVIPFAYWLEGDRPSRRSLVGGVLAVSGAIALAMDR